MKFSIVTPVYNGERYIAETIESVLSQEGDFEIEYIIQDGGSTDNTLTIIKSYDEKIKNKHFPVVCSKVTLQWYSEKDRSMYDAVNKGFTHATGDIFAYINADDTYSPKAFETIARTLKKYPEIKWIKGITHYKYEDANIVPKPPMCFIYNQEWIMRGIYGRSAYFIQQDSVFWKKELWDRSSGIDGTLKYAGDYDLWIKFAHLSPLWSINHPVSSFRVHAGQLSDDMVAYQKEQKLVSSKRGVFDLFVKLFFWVRSKTPTKGQSFLDFLYPLVFLKRNRYYVNIDKNTGEPTICKTKKFIIS